VGARCVFCVATKFKIRATFFELTPVRDRYQAKIAGRSWRKTKNAPAIANVRAQDVTRKKNFMKIWKM
jgi:hypothetical protein